MGVSDFSLQVFWPFSPGKPISVFSQIIYMNSETLVFWGYPLGKFSVSGDLPQDNVPSLYGGRSPLRKGKENG